MSTFPAAKVSSSATIDFACRRVDGVQHRYRSWMQRSATRSSASGFPVGYKLNVRRDFGAQTRRAGDGNAAPLLSGVGVLRNHRYRGHGVLAFRRFEAEGGRELLFLKERPSSSL